MGSGLAFKHSGSVIGDRSLTEVRCRRADGRGTGPSAMLGTGGTRPSAVLWINGRLNAKQNDHRV